MTGNEWAAEAEARWGQTDSYRESQRRAARYTEEDWTEMKAQADAGLRAYADAMAGGLAPTSHHAMHVAENHRAFISNWFYDCDYTMQRNLAEMYVSDERFRATYDSVAPGLAQYVHDAVLANCPAHGAI